MIEVVSTNGFRRMINPTYIVTIAELRNNGRSNTVITLPDGDKAFVDDTYDNVKASIKEVKNKR